MTAGTTFNGNAITVPVPVKTGYTFTKWVLVNSTTEFNGTYVINEDTQVIAQYTAIPETTQPPAPTQPPTQALEPTTQAPTEAPTASTQPTTEAATEVITEEAVAEGNANIFDFDSFIDESEAVTEATEVTEVVELINEATPLADALPQTGQLPVELFYGVGGLITAAGVLLKKRS